MDRPNWSMSRGPGPPTCIIRLLQSLDAKQFFTSNFSFHFINNFFWCFMASMKEGFATFYGGLGLSGRYQEGPSTQWLIFMLSGQSLYLLPRHHMANEMRLVIPSSWLAGWLVCPPWGRKTLRHVVVEYPAIFLQAEGRIFFWENNTVMSLGP